MAGTPITSLILEFVRARALLEGRIYHRGEEDLATVLSIRDSGELWGRPARNIYASNLPCVKAHWGPIDKDFKGFEFYTAVEPDTPRCHPPLAHPRWYGPREGVVLDGDRAIIKVIVTRIRGF